MVEKTEVQISDAALKSVAIHSALAGLCPLIPVPFVDDLIIERIHRRLNRELFELNGLTLSDGNAKTLAESPSKLMAAALKKIIFWPIKKLITKVVYFLAIKSCADVAASIFHEGWLLARALEAGYVPQELLQRGDPPTIKRLRAVIIRAREAVDMSPTQAVMRSAFGVGREVFGEVLSALRKTLLTSKSEGERLSAAKEDVGGITDRIVDEVRRHWSHGAALDEALRASIQLGESIFDPKSR